MNEERLKEQAPGWYRITKEVLRKGTATHMTALTKAHDLYQKYTGNDDWRNIPETYWEMALEELHIPE